METGQPLFTKYELQPPPLSIFMKRLPTDNGQLHFCLPAGIGDNLWFASKLWTVVASRDCFFWLPADEQRRSGDLFRMFGWSYGYMPGMSTEWVWSQPGSPPIPDTGAVLPVQPNKHLEHGHRIEKWYPDLPFKNPAELLQTQASIYRLTAGSPNYVVVFMCQQGYMEDGGNLLPGIWARILKRIEEQIGPALVIGAGRDVDFAQKVFSIFDPSMAPVFNAPLDAIVTTLQGCEMCFGAAGGPTILSTYLGKPTFLLYPRWLAPMPGTWEHEGAVWGSAFLDEAELKIMEGLTFNGQVQASRMREVAEPGLNLHVPVPVEPPHDTRTNGTKAKTERTVRSANRGKREREASVPIHSQG